MHISKINIINLSEVRLYCNIAQAKFLINKDF